MDLHGISAAYDHYGSFGPHPDIADLVESRLSDYGPALQTIELTAHLHSEGATPPTLGGLRSEFDRRLESLPTVRFRRSAHTLSIDFLSECTTADEALRRPQPPEAYAPAAVEIEAALGLVAKRIKPADDFDLDRFLADVHDAVLAVPDVTDWAEVRETALARLQAKEAADPWGALEIDWATFHPDARSLLDDPFLWSGSDERSPNGNDTGFDLLRDFQAWDRRSPEGDPFAFLAELLRSWDLAFLDRRTADDAAIRAFATDEPMAFDIGNQAQVATAFACIKVRGACPRDAARAALAAHDDEMRIRQASGSGDDDETRDLLERVRSTLADYTS